MCSDTSSADTDGSLRVRMPCLLLLPVFAVAWLTRLVTLCREGSHAATMDMARVAVPWSTCLSSLSTRFGCVAASADVPVPFTQSMALHMAMHTFVDAVYVRPRAANLASARSIATLLDSATFMVQTVTSCINSGACSGAGAGTGAGAGAGAGAGSGAGVGAGGADGIDNSNDGKHTADEAHLVECVLQQLPDIVTTIVDDLSLHIASRPVVGASLRRLFDALQHGHTCALRDDRTAASAAAGVLQLLAGCCQYLMTTVGQLLWGFGKADEAWAPRSGLARARATSVPTRHARSASDGDSAATAQASARGDSFRRRRRAGVGVLGDGGLDAPGPGLRHRSLSSSRLHALVHGGEGQRANTEGGDAPASSPGV